MLPKKWHNLKGGLFLLKNSKLQIIGCYSVVYGITTFKAFILNYSRTFLTFTAVIRLRAVIWLSIYFQDHSLKKKNAIRNLLNMFMYVSNTI